MCISFLFVPHHPTTNISSLTPLLVHRLAKPTAPQQNSIATLPISSSSQQPTSLQSPRYQSIPSFIYDPQDPKQATYKLFPINFLFAKLNHHLLGLSLPSSYILASRRMASSCRTCERYWRRVSASWREVGGLNI